MEKIIFNIAVNLPGFLIAIVCHEWAHAYVSYRFGDNTAKSAGRLSFNPLVHIDPFGTIVMPLIGAISGWMMFGWAKPVPIDPRKYKNSRKGIFWVSFAGPGMNILLAVSFAIVLGMVVTKLSTEFYFYMPLIEILKSAVVINLILAVFNLIPFPPLDGSRMVSAFLSYDAARKYEGLQRYTLIFILVLWFTPILRFILSPALAFGNGLIYYFVQFFA